MISILDPRLWLVILLAIAAAGVAGYWRGAKDVHAEFAAKEMIAIRAAREAENDLQRINARATSAYIERIRKQMEKARALPKIALPVDCPVPADVSRLLNDAQRPVRDDAGAGSGAGAASAEVDSTCAAELDIAKRNYAEVCIPNAEQLTELQERWALVQKMVNQKKQ